MRALKFGLAAVLALLLVAPVLTAPAGAEVKNMCHKSFQECIDELVGQLASRGWFGMLFANSAMTPDGEELPDDLHIFAFEVMSEGPAADGGVKEGDVILKVNGKAYNDLAELDPVRNAMKVGEVVSMTVKRDGKELELKLTLDEPPASMVAVWLGEYIQHNLLEVKNEMVVH